MGTAADLRNFSDVQGIPLKALRQVQGLLANLILRFVFFYSTVGVARRLIYTEAESDNPPDIVRGTPLAN